MKKIIFLVIILVIIIQLHAQNIGIGTAAPNASAQLDIASTNKGLLIPRMTSTNRVLIPNPANGLLVYDTTLNRIYQYQDGSWRYFINDSYWRKSSSHDWVYTTTDSVGIGTSVPAHRLDVNGNIRSRDDLLADGRMIAAGIVSGSSLQTPGNLAVSGIGIVNGNFTTNGNLTTNSNLSAEGTSLLTGNVTTNGDIIVNNTGATLQLRDGSNVNKGFFQLAGDDLRFGTNSGNSLGNVIVRMNGNNRFQFAETGRFTLFADNTPTLYFNTGGVNKAYLQLQGDNLRLDAPGNKLYIGDDMTVDDATGRVGIGTTTPDQKLHVNGNMVVTGTATIDGGRITGTDTGPAYNMLPLAYGKVSSNGNRTSGTTNFTSANRVGVGDYNIFVTGTNSSSIVILSANRVVVFRVMYQSLGWYKLWVWDPILDEYADCDFQFVIYHP